MQRGVTMKTVSEIVFFLESELEEAYRRHEYWKNRIPSEARKYRIIANELEHILEEIGDPEEPPTPPEEPVNILVSMPEAEKPKKSLLEKYLIVFSVIVFVTSYFVIDSKIYDLVAHFKISGIVSAFLHYGYLLVHIVSSFLLLFNSHKLIKIHEE